jgi:hypothetical protein
MMPPAPLDERVEERAHAREIFIRHHVRYEISPYFIVLDVRRPGGTPSLRRIQAGYDIDLFGNHFDHVSGLSFANDEPRKTLIDLCAAARVAIGQPVGSSTIEIVPGDATLVLNLKSHLDPEAMVRIRITHSRGLDQSAGVSEEKTFTAVIEGLKSLGVQKSE